jgi:class III poly(R)-hydroxyalkanoic acid synthase PhaE subunit
MTEKQSEDTGTKDAFNQWTQSMNDMWGGIMRLWAPATYASPNTATAEASDTDKARAERIRASVEAALSNWQNFSGTLSDPASLESFLKGAGAMPEVLAHLAFTSFRGFTEAQQKILDQAGRLGEHFDTQTFAQIDENFFRTLTEMYEKEFSRFLQIPKLGLVREYQERVSQAADTYNRFQVTLNEFLHLLSVPVSRSFAVLQEQVNELSEKNELPEDGRAYYDMWIKVLEGHYMTLFQTPEYIEILGRTLNSLTEFQQARNAVVEDMIGNLPIPTRSEIDSLYQEVHRLKRRLRELEKK